MESVLHVPFTAMVIGDTPHVVRNVRLNVDTDVQQLRSGVVTANKTYNGSASVYVYNPTDFECAGVKRTMYIRAGAGLVTVNSAVMSKCYQLYQLSDPSIYGIDWVAESIETQGL